VTRAGARGPGRDSIIGWRDRGVAAPVGGAGSGRTAPPLDELAVLVNRVTYASGDSTEDDMYLGPKRALAYVDGLRARRPSWRCTLW
jgi:hypothetical protein